MNHWKNSMWVFKQVSLSNFAWIFSDMSKNLKDCGQDLSNLYDYILLAFRIKILTFSKKLLFLILYRVSLLLKKAMATHSITLAWRIPWMEEPSGLQSMGSLRVWHDWVTWLSLSCTGEGNGNPLQCSCLENPRDREAWWAAVCGVAQSRTRLMRCSSSSRTI